MRKIIALIHLSLDGFASGPNDELDWVAYDSELESYSHSLHKQMDAVIWGRKTYEGMASYWPTVPNDPNSPPSALEHAHFLENATKIVVSRTLDSFDWPGAGNTLLIKDNLADEINSLKQKPGKDIWLIGSIALARTFIELDLIDEFLLTVSPRVLGHGKPLFAGVNRKFSLTLLESTALKSGLLVLRYTPVR